MALFLEILDGELRGTRTPLHSGLVIGRKAGPLTIRDSKLSSKHASVEVRPDGSLWLVDLGSSNGIKTPTGRVRELKLDAGISFTLGRTPFQVISTDAPVNEEQPTAMLAVTVTRTFWDNLRDLALRGANESANEARDVVAIVPPLRLQITQGIQTGTEWTLGYGPRSVGKAAIDLHLLDPAAPDLCFRLIPERGGIVFKNVADALLNGKKIDRAVLKNGDVIEISDNQIRVVFDE